MFLIKLSLGEICLLRPRSLKRATRTQLKNIQESPTITIPETTISTGLYQQSVNKPKESDGQSNDETNLIPEQNDKCLRKNHPDNSLSIDRRTEIFRSTEYLAEDNYRRGKLSPKTKEDNMHKSDSFLNQGEDSNIEGTGENSLNVQGNRSST